MESPAEVQPAAFDVQAALSWVKAAGGPDVQCDDKHHVTGLHEKGWWVFPDHLPDQLAGLTLKLHTPWTEPVTGRVGVLLVNLAPADAVVRWSSCFMWYALDKKHIGVIPVRGEGTARDFNTAHRTALAWRPRVGCIDGIELWTDPVDGEGSAIGLGAGDLSWRRGKTNEPRIHWRYDVHGLKDVMAACGGWLGSLTGACDTLTDMLDQVSQARGRIRAAMHQFLLNH